MQSFRTWSYTKRVPVMGFVTGDVAYYTEAVPLRPVVQYQLRIADIIKSTAICKPVMKRTPHTVNGRDQGVWNSWTPCSPSEVSKKVHVKELSKKAE